MRLLTVLFTSLFVIFGLFLVQKTLSVNANGIAAQHKISERLNDYLVNDPDQTLIMDSKLREISALSLSDNDQNLLAVQDELGIIFHIEKSTGKISREEKFGKKGDYEGVEFFGGMTYAVNSSGVLFRKAAGKEAEKISTFLNESYDIEGLGQNTAGDRLLLACKEAGKGEKHQRFIYSFDPILAELDEHAFLTIDGKELEKQMALKKPIFSPSAICAYKDKYYLLSSKSKAIIVLDQNGVFLEGARLSPSLHRQPEGITIDANGTLFISNEADNGVAKIYVYHLQNQGK